MTSLRGQANDKPPFADSSSEEGKPEESEPCTSTDDDSSLAGQEQVAVPGLATPTNNASEDPTILDPDSDSSLPVPDDSAAKSDSQTKNVKDPGEWPKYRTGSLRDMLEQAEPHQDKEGNFPRDEGQRKVLVAHYNRRTAHAARVPRPRLVNTYQKDAAFWLCCKPFPH